MNWKRALLVCGAVAVLILSLALLVAPQTVSASNELPGGGGGNCQWVEMPSTCCSGGLLYHEMENVCTGETTCTGSYAGLCAK